MFHVLVTQSDLDGSCPAIKKKKCPISCLGNTLTRVFFLYGFFFFKILNPPPPPPKKRIKKIICHKFPVYMPYFETLIYFEAFFGGQIYYSFDPFFLFFFLKFHFCDVAKSGDHQEETVEKFGYKLDMKIIIIMIIIILLFP
jgi:hypothetical protein